MSCWLRSLNEAEGLEVLGICKPMELTKVNMT